MEVKDKIIEEIWKIKDSLAEESGGDLHKLAEVIKKEASAALRTNSSDEKSA